MRIIDLRSDTVTKPTEGMRAAMAAAPVGDDVYGEDPTVSRLEAVMAERLGKEAGLFVASGTMGNLVAILTHASRGDEMILGDLAHTFLYEGGGAAGLGGVHPHPIRNASDGSLPLAAIKAAIRADDVHFPRTRLICLENTHNRCGGHPLTPEYWRRRRRAGSFPRDLGSPRRSTPVQRRDRPRRRSTRPHPCRRLGDGLPVQGARCTGRVSPVRVACVHRGGASGAEDGGGRDAPGRDHRCCRALRP